LLTLVSFIQLPTTTKTTRHIGGILFRLATILFAVIPALAGCTGPPQSVIPPPIPVVATPSPTLTARPDLAVSPQATPDIQATVQAMVAATVQSVPPASAQSIPPTAPPSPAAASATSPSQSSPVAAPAASPVRPSLPSEAVVEVNLSKWYKNRVNYTHFVGWIENKGLEAIAFPEIAISLISDSGATVGALSALYKPQVLQPGARAPWYALETKPANFKEVKVQARARPFAGIYGERNYTTEFKLDGVSIVPAPSAGLSARIAGQVINAGSKSTEYISVLIAVLDSSDQLLDVGSGDVKIRTLSPGQSSPFDTGFSSELKEIVRYEIFVEGRYQN
jgi:hypothetical protein